MKTTNKHNLPQGIYDALRSDDYDLQDTPRNILSVTSIIGAPLYRELQYRYWDRLEEDAVDCVWKLFGGAVHSFVDSIGGYKNPGANRLTEERWFYDLRADKIYTVNKRVKFWETGDYDRETFYVSGKPDCYDGDEECIEDYKVTSVFAITMNRGKVKPEWVSQVNCYAAAFRALGFPVKKARVICILRDWSYTKVFQDGYPKASIVVIDVPLWEQGAAVEYIKDRARMHLMASRLKDDEIPLCTDEERWHRPGKMAVMKPGRKTAVKLFGSDVYGREEAGACAENIPGGYVVHRPGKDVRCESYCLVAKFCRHGKNLTNGGECE